MTSFRVFGITGLVLAATAAVGLAQARTTKFHVRLGAGPFAGTYDVASDACDAGLHKSGSWNALWEGTDATKGKLSSVMVGLDPKPSYGSGITAVVEFGGDEHKVLYEVQKAVPTITDRGTTATLIFKGRGRVADYDTGNFEDGGEVEIKVECGKVTRY
jgi:hypothetical protein